MVPVFTLGHDHDRTLWFRPPSHGRLQKADAREFHNSFAYALVFRACDRVLDGRHVLAILIRVLQRAKIESQLVDLARELERTIITILDGRNSGAGIQPDVEVFVFGERDRSGVIHVLRVHFLAVHRQHARAALAETGAVDLEVEHNGVLAGAQFRPFPNRALEVEQIVKKHHLAVADSQFALGQEQAVTTEATALGDDHAFAAAVRNLDIGC